MRQGKTKEKVSFDGDESNEKLLRWKNFRLFKQQNSSEKSQMNI
jgi:hypothetical protein